MGGEKPACIQQSLQEVRNPGLELWACHSLATGSAGLSGSLESEGQMASVSEFCCLD